MKNYLLKITSLSILCFSLLLSCSDDEDTTTPEETPEETLDITLTNCYTCPGYSEDQSSLSNPEVITVTVPEAIVCEGEDGKAYVDNTLNEDYETFEEYLEFRQSRQRCTKNE